MNLRQKLLIKIAGALNINLLGTAYQSRGVKLPSLMEANGESRFLEYDLVSLIGKREKYIFFDVGQNIGEYTMRLAELGLQCSIHGFEPNVNLANKLELKFGNNSEVKLNKLGLGSQAGAFDLHVYNDDLHTSHGSIYSEVFSDLHRSVETQTVSIAIDTIDNYCTENEVGTIDFVKIDVEGNELEVLKGAANTIPRISVIQFEFNEMNVVSRVFMRDFYEVLQGFDFFRINVNALIPLGDYSSNHEIFSIQNIVAVNRNIN